LQAVVLAAHGLSGPLREQPHPFIERGRPPRHPVDRCRSTSPHLLSIPSKIALPSGGFSLESTPGNHVVVSVGNGLPPPLLVPSSWFCTTSTASSSSEPRVYCNTLPTIGFAGFCPLSGTPPSAISALRSLPSVCSLLVVTTTRECGVHRRGLPSRSFQLLCVSKPLLPAISTRPDAADPQGLAPQPGPLPTRTLPHTQARSFPGLA